MTRRFLAILMIGTLAGAPSALSAQLSTHLVVAAGVALPVGTLRDNTDAGYNLSAGLDLGAPLVPVGVRLEGGYNSFNLKAASGGTGTARAISGTANVVVALGPTGASPYLIGGVGMYNAHTSATALGITGTSSKTVGGVNIGGGIRFPLGVMTTFVEARYHQLLGNSTDGTDWKYVPVTFGISF